MYHLDDLSTGSFPPDTPYYSLSAQNYWTLAGETNYWTLAGETNYTGEESSLIRARKDEKAVCGKKPLCARDCSKQKNKNKDCCVTKARWLKCIDDVRAYNLQVWKEQGGAGTPPSDSTPLSQEDAQKIMSDTSGADIQDAGVPAAGGKTLMWVIIGLAVLVALFLAYKKFAVKKQ